MLILSLNTDIERRMNIESQLKKLNISYSFFDAIKPEQIPDEICALANPNMTLGEKACAYSHISMYKKIIDEEKKYEIILEDDAVVNSNLKNYLEVVEELHEVYDVVIIGYSKVNQTLSDKIKFFRPSIKIKYKSIGVRIPYKQWHCGTVGYSISKYGAMKLLNINNNLQVPADYWEYFEKKGLKIVHYEDILVTENFLEFTSHLESDRNTYKNPSMFLRYSAGILRHFILPYRYLIWKISIILMNNKLYK